MLEPFLGKSAFAKHGQRVVKGQRLMQAASDIMLGWMRITTLDGVDRDFYVRQLWDGKGSALVEIMDPAAMTAYAGFCGQALAKAHARSGDAIAIASYLGAGDSFDRALAFVRRGLRRPERTRLRRPAGRRRHRARYGRDRSLTVAGRRGSPASASRAAWSRARPSVDSAAAISSPSPPRRPPARRPRAGPRSPGGAGGRFARRPSR